MRLQFTSREAYAERDEPFSLDQIKLAYPGAYLIAEGGGREIGHQGLREILSTVEKSNYSHICCSVGTGTMLRGIANSMLPSQELIGICVLKGMEGMSARMASEFGEWPLLKACSIQHDYHFGGYAKKNEALIQYMNSIYHQTGIPIDFVYTAKLFYAVQDLAKVNHFKSGSRILVIHSGGLQGNLSLPRECLTIKNEP